MPVYATVDDLTNPPDNAENVLILASALVTEATMTAFYAVDEAGLPTDPEILSRFKAATIAQVGHWSALNIDPTQGAAGVTAQRQASSKSIGSASISYESSETATAERVASLTTLGPVALSILGSLAKGPVIVHG